MPWSTLADDRAGEHVESGEGRWWDPELPHDAEPIVTCTIITTEANADVEALHDRMPVIIEHSDVATWLDVSEGRARLLRPADDGMLSHYEVDPAVGSVKNDGPELVAPIEDSQVFYMPTTDDDLPAFKTTCCVSEEVFVSSQP
ncbi:MAG: SOS response-associated peptidase family protein [Acidimicrobiales bacterium]